MAKCATIGCGSQAAEVIEHGPADDRASDQVCTPCADGYERRPALRVTRRPVSTAPFWGACGESGCTECRPLFDKLNQPIPGTDAGVELPADYRS